MIKIVSVIVLVLALSFGTKAQSKIAIIDTKYILEKLPEYKAAQTKLDNLSNDWQTSLEAMQAKVDNMKKDFEAEQIMLSTDLKKKRELEIANKEDEAREYQRKKFGFEGELFKKRAEFIKPIQDRVYASIQKLAQNGAYDLILDKSAGITVIFADPKLDRTEDVLLLLGVK